MSKYGVFSGPYSVQMRESTDQEKLRIWTLFTQWMFDWVPNAPLTYVSFILRAPFVKVLSRDAVKWVLVILIGAILMLPSYRFVYGKLAAMFLCREKY